MTIILHPDITQGSDEWLAARCGLVTASIVGRLLTPTLKVADNDVSRGVTWALVAERLTGHVEPVPMSSAMWRGVEEEPLARAAYIEHHAPVTEVGFIVREFDGYQIGFSPDGLVGDDGLIEVKSRAQKTQVQTILEDRIPPANLAQLQCGLLVSGRAWVDYVSYSSGMPLWVKRVTPDPKFHDAIMAAAETFEARAAAMVLRYRASVEGLPVMDRTPDYAEMSV